MNIQAIMQQAKKMQSNLEKISKEIEEKDYEISNSNFNIVMKGNYQVKSINILNNDILNDKEIFEEMLIVSLNEALNKIKNEKENKLGKYTNGLGGLF